MPVFKLVTKYLYSNAGRGPGSWSENWYYSGTLADAAERLYNLNGWRMKLSGTAVTIIEQKAIDLALPGVSNALGAGVSPQGPFLGNEPLNSDVPQMALAFKMRASNSAKRTFLLKGIPDDIVKVGRYVPSSTYLYNVRQWCNALVNAGFSLRTVDKTQTPVDVVSISSTGLLVMANDQTWAVGNKIQLYRCTDVNKQGVVGTLPITVRTDARTYQLGQWGTRNAVVRGKARQLLFGYPVIIAVGNTPTATVGKIGSPSGPYVGRRSSRR